MTSARRLWLASIRPTWPDWRWWAPVAALAAVVYPALLLSARGRVVADTHGDLYIDPGGLLANAASMWNPTVGLGTVTQAEHLLLWPTGPFYWVMTQLSVPMWVAQRLWLGSLIVLAGAGVLFLARTWRWRPAAAGASAFVYALSPFLLTVAVGSSVSLLPFAGLPWLLALAVRATRSSGWRHPALFALVIGTVGPGEPAALVLLAGVPLAWILYARMSMERVSRARATSTVAKVGLLTLTVNLWWIAGVSVQSTNGLDLVRYGPPAELAAATSTAPEVLRGLGFWGFYDGSRLGPSLDFGVSYTQQLWLLAVTFALPALGLLGLGMVRWRHRAFVVGLAIVSVVVAVGAHPWAEPSPIGRAVRRFLETEIGAGFGALTWMVPAIALASAIGIGALVGAIAQDLPRVSVATATAVAVVALAAVPPLWAMDLLDDDQASRPGELPSYWHDAAAHLDARALDASGESDAVFTAPRVLELPGIDRATYPWGYTGEPVLAGLIDRGHVIRQLLPQGSAGSADLIRALDRRLQTETLDPAALVPVARLMGVGDVVVRNEALPPDATGSPFPHNIVPLAWEAFGEDAGTPFGGSALWAFEVPDPRPLVDVVGTRSEVLISGDADGLIDAAGAGLIDGTELIRYSASITDEPTFVTDHLIDDRALIITDTNRSRAQRWDRISDTEGYTEQANAGVLGDDPEDHRLPVFDERPGTEAVAEQRTLSVRATGYGGNDRYDTSVRPANAADGDPATAWLVGADSHVVGHRLELRATAPVTTDTITLAQPDDAAANRWITEVQLSFDGSDPLVVDLDADSRRRGGQVVDIGLRTFGTLSIEITGDSVGPLGRYDGLDGVGFADIGITDLEVDELIRMPSDIVDNGGFRTLRYPLAIVQTRNRVTPTSAAHPEEAVIARALRLPTERTYQVTGTARLSPTATEAVRAALVETRSTERPDHIDTGCRGDLLSVGGEAVDVRVTGDAEAATIGGTLAVEACDAVTLPGGDHDFRTAHGATTGIDIDQIVWCSASGGSPCDAAAPFIPTTADGDGPQATVTGSDHATVNIEVTGINPGEPFWLVLGQSFDSGWEIIDDDIDAHTGQLVNGYANGYRITSNEETEAITLRFTPQNRVEIAFLLSLIAAAAALLLCLSPARPLYPVPISQMEPLRRIRALSWEGALPTKRNAVIVGAVAAAATALVVNPAYGLVVAALAGLGTRREGWRPVFTVLPGALVAACGLYIFAIQFRNEIEPGVAWVHDTSRFHSLALMAVILLGIDVAIERVWIRNSEYQ